MGVVSNNKPDTHRYVYNSIILFGRFLVGKTFCSLYGKCIMRKGLEYFRLTQATNVYVSKYNYCKKFYETFVLVKSRMPTSGWR